MTDDSNNSPPFLRQTIFHVESSLYSFDVKPTVTFYDLKKILAAAAHLPKNSFNIYHENEDLTPFEDSTLESFFPTEPQIHFTITIDIDTSKEKEPTINLNLDKYCSKHKNKFLIYYCYDCKRSICSRCYSYEHLNHKIIEKYDYLHPTSKLVDNMFQVNDNNNYDQLYSFKDNVDKSVNMYELQTKLKSVLFTKLHELLNQIEHKVNELITVFNTSSEITKINIDYNCQHIKDYCIDGLDQLKKDINIRNIVNNEEIFLTFDKKYHELHTLKTRLKNDNEKFNSLNLNYDTIETLTNTIYTDIETVLIEKLNLIIYDSIKQNIQSNLVNQLTREEIIDFIYTDIQVPTRKTLKRSLNNKSLSARNSVAVANPNPQYKIENEINNNISHAMINHTQPQLQLNANYEIPTNINEPVNPLPLEQQQQQHKSNNTHHDKEHQFSFTQILHNEIEKASQFQNINETEYLMFPIKNNPRILIYNGDENKVKNEIINFPMFCKIREFFENCAHCNYKNKLYISGGIDKSTSETSNVLLKYDPNYNTIISLASLPSPHQCHSMLAYNDKLYIIGGKQTNLCEIYNFNALKFEHMSPLIFEERQWPMLIVYNHFLYAFLGLASGGYMKSIERINIRNPKAKWELVPFKNDEELNLEKHGCGLILKESMRTLFFFGGKNNNEVFTNVFNFSFDDFSFSDCKEQCKEAMFFKENQLHYCNSTYCNFNEETGKITQFNITNNFEQE